MISVLQNSEMFRSIVGSEATFPARNPLVTWLLSGDAMSSIFFVGRKPANTCTHCSSDVIEKQLCDVMYIETPGHVESSATMYLFSTI